LAASLLVAAVSGVVYSPPRGYDLNGDGQTNIRDVQLLAAVLLGQATLTCVPDINQDGRVDILDFQLLLMKTSGKSSNIQKLRADLLEATLKTFSTQNAPTGRTFLPNAEAAMPVADLPSLLIPVQDYPPPGRQLPHAGIAIHAPPILI
jgi:hypothetical protein